MFLTVWRQKVRWELWICCQIKGI